MGIAVMYDISTRVIRLVGNNVNYMSSDLTTIKGENWEWDGLSYITDNVIVLEDDVNFIVGDTIPDGVVDIKDKFIKISQEEKIESLESENAELWFENIVQQSKTASHEQELADLWYVQLTGGM